MTLSLLGVFVHLFTDCLMLRYAARKVRQCLVAPPGAEFREADIKECRAASKI